MMRMVPCSSRYVGCGPPVCSHTRLDWHCAVKSRSRFSGLRTLSSSLYLGSSWGAAGGDGRGWMGVGGVGGRAHPSSPPPILPPAHRSAAPKTTQPAPYLQQHDARVVVRHTAQHLDHRLQKVHMEHGLGQLNVPKVAGAVQHAVAVGGALRWGRGGTVCGWQHARGGMLAAQILASLLYTAPLRRPLPHLERAVHRSQPRVAEAAQLGPSLLIVLARLDLGNRVAALRTWATQGSAAEEL